MSMIKVTKRNGKKEPVMLDKILDRIKTLLKTTVDAEVASVLGVKPQNIINWRKRQGVYPIP